MEEDWEGFVLLIGRGLEVGVVVVGKKRKGHEEMGSMCID